MVISRSICSTFSGARNCLLSFQGKRICHLLGAALMVLAMQPAHSQVDSNSFPVQNSPAEQLVSKNQLLAPEKAQKAMARASEHFLHGRYESAQKEIQRALDICPHCASALTFEGVLNLQSHNYPEAARSFQQAIDEDPAAGPAYLGIGVVYNAQARFKEALAVFDRAAPFLPDSWLLPFECALAHLGVGESMAGLREMSHAEGLAGSDPAKLSGVAYLHGVAEFQLKHYDAATQFFEEAIKHDPKGTFARLAKEHLDRITPLLAERNNTTGVVNQSAVDSTTGVNGRANARPQHN